jgi:energy-coupling factor transporter ATP-binding protein EcfA2
MRITSITAENFLGARQAALTLGTAVTLIAGPNAAGKSSIRDAVALALTSDLGRVHLKKEAGQLVHGDATAGYVEVVNADGDTWGMAITAAGKLTDSAKGREADPVFPFVLDAQRFARLDETERRKFLFELMGVKMAPAEIKGRLIDRLYPKGCNGEEMLRVERVLPLLRAGFDAASGEAKTKATAAKGAWRAISGETYGKVKADTWRAAVPPFDAKDLAAAQHQLAAIEADLGAVQTQIGELQAAKKAHDEQLARVASLTETAGKLERIKTKLAKDEEELKGWGEEVVRLRALAGAGPRVGLVHELAAALASVIEMVPSEVPQYEEVRLALSAYEKAHGKLGAAGDKEAAAKLPEADRSIDFYAKAVGNDKRDLASAERAADDLKTIGASTWAVAPLTAAQEHLANLQADRKTQTAVVDALRAAKAAAEGAAKKTTEAAAHHADVAAWDAIGDALSPDGIPADLLAEAIKPINDRLEQSAADAEWLQVVIGGDMHITSAGRPYALLSESEKWRVDAMVAEAVANLSGARLLVLDRMDVLDLQGRADLFAWLDVLATNGEIDSALVFGTLKALPADLPATVSGHWIENGVVAQPLQAAA